MDTASAAVVLILLTRLLMGSKIQDGVVSAEAEEVLDTVVFAVAG